MCTEVKEVERSSEQQRQAEIRFLSRMARKQTPDRQEDPAEFLLNIARLRICLGKAAQLLVNATVQGVFDFNHMHSIIVQHLVVVLCPKHHIFDT